MDPRSQQKPSDQPSEQHHKTTGTRRRRRYVTRAWYEHHIFRGPPLTASSARCQRRKIRVRNSPDSRHRQTNGLCSVPALSHAMDAGIRSNACTQSTLGGQGSPSQGPDPGMRAPSRRPGILKSHAITAAAPPVVIVVRSLVQRQSPAMGQCILSKCPTV
jgi:hypothetical protein